MKNETLKAFKDYTVFITVHRPVSTMNNNMQHMDHSPHYYFFITLCILSYPTATTALGLKIHIQVRIYSIFRCNSYGEIESFGWK